MKEVKPNPCIGCGIHCCSQNVINVCGYDVWGIARELLTYAAEEKND